MKKLGVLRYSIHILFFLLGINALSAQEEPKPIINASLVGKVIDASNKEPISGVTIQLEAVTHSVKTDGEGRFQFVTGQKLPFTLILSFVGYEKKKIVVNASPA